MNTHQIPDAEVLENTASEAGFEMWMRLLHGDRALDEELTGALWMAGGLAVCAFLSDLAALVAVSNTCPACDGDGIADTERGGGWVTCSACHGTGKRVAP